MSDLGQKLFRFGLVGGVTTALAYVTFAVLIRLGAFYLIAGCAAWATGVGVSYLLNRTFTFRVRTTTNAKEFALFVAGYLLQLALGLSVYGILIGRLNLNTSLAFLLNVAVTAVFSFCFMRLAVFRAPSSDQSLETAGLKVVNTVR